MRFLLGVFLLALAGPAWCQVTPEIGYPLEDVRPRELRSQFKDKRRGHIHHASDLMRPRGTPILAVTDGYIKKLSRSRTGGISIHLFDEAEEYNYFYAHIDHYAKGLREGQHVKRGDVIAYVGSTGNARRRSPHLHFAVSRVPEDKRYWGGEPMDPYPLLVAASSAAKPAEDVAGEEVADEDQVMEAPQSVPRSPR